MEFFFFFQAEDGIRDTSVTGVQTCALPISCLGFRAGQREVCDRLPGIRRLEIGRASCRERVWILVVGGSVKERKALRRTLTNTTSWNVWCPKARTTE